MSEEIRVFTVDRLDCRLVAHHWGFAEAQAEEIDRRWAARVRANPSLYDGPVLLACRAEIVARGGERVLELDAFLTSFSRFLVWRDMGWPDRAVYNCFAMPAVRSSDGAYLVGEMAPGHSAEGMRYFPGGTPDPADVLDGGVVDLAGSLARELTEEAGLSVADGLPAPGWTVIFDSQRVACLKQYDWPLPAAALREQVRAYLAAEVEPELSDVHMIAPGPQCDPRLPGFMAAFLSRVAVDGG